MPLKDYIGAITGGAQWAANMLGIGHAKQDRRQVNQQRELNKINVENAEKEHELKMRYWKDTGIGAQLEAGQEAGVSRAAIISGGASGMPGGATISGGGGNAADAAATTQAETNKAMTAAQLGLITAQTEKLNAETGNITAGTGATEATTEKTGQETKNLRLDGEMKKIDLLTKGMTQQTTIEGIKAEVEKLGAEILKINAEEFKGRNEGQYLAQTFQSRVAQTLQNAVKQSNEIELTKAQAKYLTEQIKVEYKKLDFAKMSLEQQKEIVADTLNTMIEGKWIDAGSRVVGDLISLIPNIKSMFGKVEDLVSTTEVRNSGNETSYDADGNETGSRTRQNRTTTTNRTPRRRN